MNDRQKTNDNPKNSLTDPAIPVDSEAVLNIDNTNKRICSTSDECYSQNILTDSFTIDIL